ncbi:uncharacterized protein LOC124411366 [Diprion similis]|uniref:uncharacterized protein LOC124411366 n=1 Tax=Diprion similis TaxID=362088 RepID=UPI001EF96DF8|nr:uncharacterized protein LOC124411366 [Diprion similis]
MAEQEAGGGIPPFNPNEDQPGVYQRWERWLRGLELLLVSKNITAAERKKAMLLHYGGFALQDVFYAIPGADTVDAQEDAYAKTKTALTDYFKPKLNATYERHIFRGMSQGASESIGQFTTRIRQQAKYCAFMQEEEEIRDQIIEKCYSSEVRKRILEKDTVTLADVLKIAQAFETMTVQVKQMEGESVAKISSSSYTTKSHSKNTDAKCSRCGYTGHSPTDERCPARGKLCNRCNKTGRFASVCRSNRRSSEEGNANNPPQHQNRNRQNNVRGIDDTETGGEDIDAHYAFSLTARETVNAIKEKGVTAEVGGVEVEFIIDSGSTCNIIDEDTWRNCKRKGIECRSRIETNKKVFAYGQESNLELMGEFDCKIEIGKKTGEATVVVMKGKGRPLLGFE